jgi:GNAT superfamily N-acetyltransferase
VHPDHAGQGIGTAMYEFVMERMKQGGMAVATVGTGGDPGHLPIYCHALAVSEDLLGKGGRSGVAWNLNGSWGIVSSDAAPSIIIWVRKKANQTICSM